MHFIKSVPDYASASQVTRGWVKSIQQPTTTPTSSVMSHFFDLQRVAAARTLALFEQGELSTEVLQSMDNELLMLVVRAIPLTEPTTEADPTPYDLSGRFALVKSPWKINIEKRIELIQTISNLRADLDRNWAEDLYNEPVMLNFEFCNRSMPRPTQLIALMQRENIKVSIIGRTSCEWENEQKNLELNSFTRVFVIENQQLAHQRIDLPQRIEPGDHVLLNTFGGLLRGYKDIESMLNNDRTEFSSSAGNFKLFYSHRVQQ
jgi:hypothetical protein